MSRKKSSEEKLLPLIPPGEILFEEFMKPLGVSQNQLARDLDVGPARIHGIIHGKRAITADTALRLAAYFGTSEELWLGLQMEYDLREARRTLGPVVAKRVRPFEAA